VANTKLTLIAASVAVVVGWRSSTLRLWRSGDSILIKFFQGAVSGSACLVTRKKRGGAFRGQVRGRARGYSDATCAGIAGRAGLACARIVRA
jgi:hypothetical protein